MKQSRVTSWLSMNHQHPSVYQLQMKNISVTFFFFFSLNICHLVLVFCVGWVRAVRQPCLPLAHVPVQTLGQAFEPVVHQVVAADGGHWVTGCGDLDTVERTSRERITAQSMGKESVAQGQQLTDNYQSPNWISCRFLPSNDTQAVFLASGERVICLRMERSTVSFKGDSKTWSYMLTSPCCCAYNGSISMFMYVHAIRHFGLSWQWTLVIRFWEKLKVL